MFADTVAQFCLTGPLEKSEVAIEMRGEKIVLFAQWDSCFPKGQVFVRGFGCLYCHHCSGSALLALKLALTQGQKRKRRLTTMGTPPHSLACRGYIGPKGAFLGVSAS